LENGHPRGRFETNGLVEAHVSNELLAVAGEK